MSNVVHLPVLNSNALDNSSTSLALVESSKFKNEYLSVSRLGKYEGCPLSFRFHYIDRLPKTPKEANNPADFGVVLHSALEAVYRWVIEEEFRGSIPMELATTAFRQAWQESKLTGLELFNEGLKIIRSYFAMYPTTDYLSILGVEVSFKIQLEEFEVQGYIDRIDKVDDTTIKVVDYKSNWMLFTQEELRSNLQMSVYALAVMTMYPWVRNIEFEFHMLRHDRPMRATRTVEQLRDAAEYVVAMGRRTEQDPEYPARLGPNCGYCEFSYACDEHKAAVASKRNEVVCDVDTFEALFADRERVAAIAKLFYTRQKQIDGVLRYHINKSLDGYVAAGGYTARLNAWSKEKRYDLERTVKVIAEQLGISKENALFSVASVDRDRLETFMSIVESEWSRGKMLLLKVELDMIMEVIPGEPRISVTAPKGIKKAALASLEPTPLPPLPADAPKLPAARKPRATKPRTSRAPKEKPVVEEVDLD